MYNEKQLSDFNDPYYLTKYYDAKNVITIYCNIDNITNHNCLNYLSYKYKTTGIGGTLSILQQNCITNNTSRPDYIRMLTKVGESYDSYYRLDIISALFNNKYYDMLTIILENTYYLCLWGQSFFDRYFDKADISNATKEIDFIINNNIMDAQRVYSYIHNNSYGHFKMKYLLLQHLSEI
jgi:hypothetical protein